MYRDGANRTTFTIAPEYYFKNFSIHEYRAYLLLTPASIYHLTYLHTNGINRRFGISKLEGNENLDSATVSEDGLAFTLTFTGILYGGLSLIS